MWSPGNLWQETEQGYCSKSNLVSPRSSVDIWKPAAFCKGGFKVPARHTEWQTPLPCQKGVGIGSGGICCAKGKRTLWNGFFMMVVSVRILPSYFSTHSTQEVGTVII